MRHDLPATRDIVLIGGGHAHALLLKSWGMDPLPGARLTVVNPGPTAPYTGMLPGYVAGHYDRDTLEIDLVRLVRFAGARLILGRATAIDRATREIAIDDRFLGARRVGYDVASVDIGIHSRMPAIPGFDEHAVAAKPLERFAERWAAWRAAGDATAPIAVIGGGVGGVELAMAMSFGMGGAPVTVIDAGRALDGVGRGAARRLRAELAAQNIALIEEARVARIAADRVVLADGREIAARFCVGAAGARAHGWLDASGLTDDHGFVPVGPTLQSRDPAIFAAGDCAALTHAPRPKAGVFAVREAPVLLHNLRAAVSGERMREYRPQAGYLKLISTGGRSAVADRAGLPLGIGGGWLWRWKDRIDRKFMVGLADLPPMHRPPLPRPRAEGMEPLTAQAPCGGCAAKVARPVLAGALSRLAPPGAGVDLGAGDDAAILSMGGARQVLTVDQIRAFTPDPALLAHVAAIHAAGDCLAMGAVPQAALAVLTLPPLSPELQGRSLAEMTDAGTAALRAIGAPIAGGHSSTGPEMQAGFVVTGLVEGTATTLAAARAGDVLVLTKPLGTGAILAAEMALEAKGAWVASCLGAMAADPTPVARALQGARAVTDVTGFGLAGHLMAMIEAAGLSARIDLGALPALPGALELLERGVRSTLHPGNAAISARIAGPQGARRELLFDPQTAGGFLAALPPERAGAICAAVEDAGGLAARIGTLGDGPPGIEAS
ncbi:selenide, water dikinase SelD [Palleronia sediminis]|uniref:Selenide, water dikinase SelD n=1 Tax=Palleronia sediminis TaxID=2547833 RepID=A0A4R6A9U4_9RHOB|nr:selenide, water dikinase SelD [Palleronia sediminis]TDL79675.1 selenide, water dikinase SelD [Palleronia sediminis]